MKDIMTINNNNNNIKYLLQICAGAGWWRISAISAETRIEVGVTSDGHMSYFSSGECRYFSEELWGPQNEQQ